MPVSSCRQRGILHAGGSIYTLIRHCFVYRPRYLVNKYPYPVYICRHPAMQVPVSYIDVRPLAYTYTCCVSCIRVPLYAMHAWHSARSSARTTNATRKYNSSHYIMYTYIMRANSICKSAFLFLLNCVNCLNYVLLLEIRCPY